MTGVVGNLELYGKGVSLVEADIEPIHYYSLIRDQLELNVYREPQSSSLPVPKSNSKQTSIRR